MCLTFTPEVIALPDHVNGITNTDVDLVPVAGNEAVQASMGHFKVKRQSGRHCGHRTLVARGRCGSYEG